MQLLLYYGPLVPTELQLLRDRHTVSILAPALDYRNMKRQNGYRMATYFYIDAGSTKLTLLAKKYPETIQCASFKLFNMQHIVWIITCLNFSLVTIGVVWGVV